MASIDFIHGALIGLGIPKSTADQVVQNFKENPKVWKAFEKFTLEAIKRGRKIGSKAIMERVRWEIEIEKNIWNEDFKVNNNFTAYYARIFGLKYPEHQEYFETREIKGLTANE